MPSPVKKSDPDTPTEEKLSRSPKSPLKKEGAKPSVKITESIASPHLAESKTTRKSELRTEAGKLAESLVLKVGGHDESPASPHLRRSEVEGDAGSSAGEARESDTTTSTKGSERATSEGKETVESSSPEDPPQSETASKADEPFASKSPQPAEDGSRAVSSELTEKCEAHDDEQAKVPDVPVSIEAAAAKGEEKPTEESAVLDTSDQSGSDKAAGEVRQSSPPQRDPQEEQPPSSPVPVRTAEFEGLGARMLESCFKELSPGSIAASQDSRVPSGNSAAADVELVSRGYAEPTLNGTGGVMDEAAATGRCSDVDGSPNGLDYGRVMADSMIQREAAISFGNKACKRVPVEGEVETIRTEPRVGYTNRRFNIILDASRYDKESILVHIVGDKIDVYCKQENENMFGEEMHEVHQIFPFPLDMADIDRLTARITLDHCLYIQAPLWKQDFDTVDVEAPKPAEPN